MDIKETREVFTAALVVSTGIKAALADGRVTFADLGHIMPALESVDKAIDRIELVDDELKDLDLKEAHELLDLAFPAVLNLLHILKRSAADRKEE